MDGNAMLMYNGSRTTPKLGDEIRVLNERFANYLDVEIWREGQPLLVRDDDDNPRTVVRLMKGTGVQRTISALTGLNLEYVDDSDESHEVSMTIYRLT